MRGSLREWEAHQGEDQARRIGSAVGLFGPRVMAMVEPDRVGTAYWEESPWVLRGLVAPGTVGLARLLAARVTTNQA